MRFDLRDLELFAAVADAGSIARAAERSHTVASAVSKRISDLEETFGAALLVGGARGVELTAAGHALLVRARVLLQPLHPLGPAPVVSMHACKRRPALDGASAVRASARTALSNSHV